MDTLAFGYILPTTGRIRDFNPLETCAAGRTRKTAVAWFVDFHVAAVCSVVIQLNFQNDKLEVIEEHPLIATSHYGYFLQLHQQPAL